MEHQPGAVLREVREAQRRQVSRPLRPEAYRAPGG